jgi:excisionase family DNA binding protein
LPAYPDDACPAQPSTTITAAADADCDQLLYRPEQVAGMLAIGRDKVFRLMASGELESFRIGGSRRIPREAVADFIARQRVAGTVGAA